MDEFDQRTDEILEDMTQRVREVYQQANQEATDRLLAFWDEVLQDEPHMRSMLDAGQITQEEFNAWMRDVAVQSAQYEAVQVAISNDLINADQIAAGITNGNLPDIYALNMNGAQFTMCRSLGYDFDPAFALYDRYTVQRLIANGESIFPQARVDVDADYLYTRRHIQNSITQGILQGESIERIAQRMEGVSQMSYNSAVRTARTLTTSAQNSGRVDSYRHAQDMGIDLQQEWMAALDSKTRDSHRALDGVRVDVGQRFPNGCRFPGDPQGPAGEIYNCRCTIVAALRGYRYHNADRWSNLPDGMTYADWQMEHSDGVSDTYRGHIYNRVPYQNDGHLTERGYRALHDELGISREDAERYTEAIYEFTHNNNRSPEVVNALDEFIRISPNWNGGPLYRGIGVYYDEIEDIVNRASNGLPINLRGLTHWSSDADTGSSYSQPHVMNRDYDFGVIFITNSSSFDCCTSVRHLSNVQGENEVIASSSAQFIPTGYEERGEVVRIFGDIVRR